MDPYKLGHLVGDEWQPFPQPHAFARQQRTGPARLVIAPHADPVGVMMDLARELPEPFGVLYLLLVSRCDQAPGRYQSPIPLSRDEMESFLAEFRTFFEKDGRHHVWVTSLPEYSTLVYDQHDCIFAYGPLDAYEGVLRARGMDEGQVRFPAPHQHMYNQAFDDDEKRVLSYWNWMHSPLQPSDVP